MKKIAVLILSFLTIPLIASLDCMTNSKNLRENFDTKEWSSCKCACPCKDIRAGKCVICCHLQQARPFTLVEQIKTKLLQMPIKYLPLSMEDVTKNFVLIHKKQTP